MKKLIILIFLLSSASANHLGTYGETFAIIEEDLLEVIQGKLKTLESSGEIRQHQLKIQKQAIAKIKRPNKVEGVTKTIQPRVFMYNPAIRVPRDLFDHRGQVFAKQGTIINPLAIHSLTKPLVFIDGDDELQVDWAIKLNPSNTKIILTSGAPFKLIEQHNRTFYFDQNGTLIKKFGISQVPARVSQKQQMLQIEEILLDEK